MFFSIYLKSPFFHVAPLLCPLLTLVWHFQMTGKNTVWHWHIYIILSFKIKKNYLIFFLFQILILLSFYVLKGLDVEKCHIIEMACLITDENLNVIQEVKAIK